MSKRGLTAEEKRINNVVRSLLHKRSMPKASSFIEEIKAFKGLRRVESVIYILCFKYNVDTENQRSGMSSESFGNYSVVSKTRKPLATLAKSFNAMSEDEQLAILTQLFPRDFEFDNEEAIIGLDSDNDEDADDEDGSKPFSAVVNRSTEYRYV